MKKLLLLITLSFSLSVVACTNASSSSNDFSSSSESSIPTKDTFTITYKNYDDSVLYSYEANKFEYPKYVGETPIRNDSEDITYVFSGWEPKPVMVMEDATYVATYQVNQRDIYLGEIQNEYFLYKDYIKKYLIATSDNDIENTSNSLNVHSYVQPGEAYAPVTFNWTQNYMDVDSVNFIYSLNQDFIDAKTISLSPNDTSVDIYNLLKGTTYYAKIEVSSQGETHFKEFSFKTSSLGPRAMKVEGITNVRDLGGYQTVDGKTTLQNMIFRGSEMNGTHNYHITENGLNTMSNDMGIKLDIDLRNSSELVEEGKVITNTPIPNAKIAFIAANNYVNSINDSSSMARIFKLLSDKRNYPAYIHCYGGADRTGTICFLINALLGVSLDDLIHDFEFTTFSAIGERNSKNVSTGSEAGKFYQMYHRLVELYPDGNLSDKVKNYLLDAGLTNTEIENIKAINLGEPLNISAKVNEVYSPSFVDKLTIDVNELNGLQKVLIDDMEVNYELGDYQIFVNHSELASLTGSDHVAKLIYEGKEKPVSCYFKSINTKVYEVEELYSINNSSACVKAQTNFAFSNSAIGYNSFVRARIKTETKQNSGFYFMIGSYGVYLRGKQVRLQRMTTSNSPGSNADFGVLGTFPSENMFNNGNLDIVLGVSVGINVVCVTFAVLNDDGSIFSDMFYETESISLKLSSGEISTSNAKFGFRFANDSTLGDGIYAYTHAQRAYVDSLYGTNDFKVYLRNVDDTAKLYLNDVEFNYVLDGFTLIVNQKDMLLVTPGEVHGVIVFNSKNFEFTFIRDEISPYYEPTYIYGDYVITLPGCDESTIVKLNNKEVPVIVSDNDLIISENTLDAYDFGTISGQIINNPNTYDFSFSKVKANVSVNSTYINGDLMINLPGVNNTAKLYLGSSNYNYTIDDSFNMIVSEADLTDLPLGKINGYINYKNNQYDFSFSHAQVKNDVSLGDGSLEYIDSDVLSYDNAIIDFDIVTNTSGNGNGHLAVGIGGYGINFRGGRLRWYYTDKLSNFVSSDFDDHASIEQEGKFSESNFSAAIGHINLVSSVDASNVVTLTVAITISKQVSDSYLAKGTYIFSHTFANNASSIIGNDIHSYFSIDGAKQISATITNYVALNG